MTNLAEMNPQLPSDAELELLTEYVGGLMTEEQALAFEERLAEDEDFFARMDPMLEAWYSNGLVPAEIEMKKQIDRERAQHAMTQRRRRIVGTTLTLAAAAGIGFAYVQGQHREAPTTDRPIAAALPPTPDTTPVKVPEQIVAAVTPHRSVKRAPKPEILNFGETEADRLLAESATQSKPELGFVLTTVDSATIEIKGTEIAAAEMPKDTAATNAYKRYIGLTTNGKNLGDGGNWLRKHLPGFLFPLGGSAKPTPVGKPPMRWMR